MIHATICGNLGRDPEQKQAGSADVLEFSVAVNSRRKGQSGYEDVTTWVRVSVWGKRGEALGRILGRGSYVVVRGELTIRDYTKRDGEPGYSVEMRADEVELGPKRQQSAGQHHEHNAADFSPAPGGIDDGDLPF